MVKRLAITVALASLSGSAFAADLRGPIVEAPPPLPVPVAAFSWTGGYAGVNVGLGSETSHYGYNVNSPGNYQPGYDVPAQPGHYQPGYDVPDQPGYYVPANYTPGTATSGSQRSSSGGVIGGVQIGYNYAFAGGFGGVGFGGFGVTPVIGVEADFDGSGVGSSSTLSDFAQGSATGTSTYVGVGNSIRYFGTVRGRLGVAFDRLLVYGTGGFAYADTDTYVSSPDNNVYAHKSVFHTGIAYGGGLEFALTYNLLLRAEYLHYDFNRKDVALGTIGCGCSVHTYKVTEKPELDVVRAGLSYKFDTVVAVPPVIARY